MASPLKYKHTENVDSNGSALTAGPHVSLRRLSFTSHLDRVDRFVLEDLVRIFSQSLLSPPERLEIRAWDLAVHSSMKSLLSCCYSTLTELEVPMCASSILMAKSSSEFPEIGLQHLTQLKKIRFAAHDRTTQKSHLYYADCTPNPASLLHTFLNLQPIDDILALSSGALWHWVEVRVGNSHGEDILAIAEKFIRDGMPHAVKHGIVQLDIGGRMYELQ